MSKINNAAEALRGYLLSEENLERLEQLRNQLFLMSSITFAATLEEEDESLNIPRSILGHCFEAFGMQLDDVLTTVFSIDTRTYKRRKRH